MDRAPVSCRVNGTERGEPPHLSEGSTLAVARGSPPSQEGSRAEVADRWFRSGHARADTERGASLDRARRRMLLLILVLVSVALVPLFGGHPQSLAEIRLRSIGLLLAAVGLQAGLVLFPGGTNVLRLGGYIGSHVLAAGFLVRNSKVPGLWLIALGAALNFSAIVANGGVMPAAPSAMS